MLPFPRLELSELETLERLCERGEMLLPKNTPFYALENLIKQGYAQVDGVFGEVAEVVHASPAGRALCTYRQLMTKASKS